MRARRHYQKTAELLPDVDRRSMIAGESMAAVYWRILRSMEKNRFRKVLDTEPIKLSKMAKLSVLMGVWIRVWLGVNSPNYACD